LANIQNIEWQITRFQTLLHLKRRLQPPSHSTAILWGLRYNSDCAIKY
jgi:hypothetical protein